VRIGRPPFIISFRLASYGSLFPILRTEPTSPIVGPGASISTLHTLLPESVWNEVLADLESSQQIETSAGLVSSQV
jgi:hypothetical protein